MKDIVKKKYIYNNVKKWKKNLTRSKYAKDKYS